MQLHRDISQAVESLAKASRNYGCGIRADQMPRLPLVRAAADVDADAKDGRAP